MYVESNFAAKISSPIERDMCKPKIKLTRKAKSDDICAVYLTAWLHPIN